MYQILTTKKPRRFDIFEIIIIGEKLIIFAEKLHHKFLAGF